MGLFPNRLNKNGDGKVVVPAQSLINRAYGCMTDRNIILFMDEEHHSFSQSLCNWSVEPGVAGSTFALSARESLCRGHQRSKIKALVAIVSAQVTKGSFPRRTLVIGYLIVSTQLRDRFVIKESNTISERLENGVVRWRNGTGERCWIRACVADQLCQDVPRVPN